MKFSYKIRGFFIFLSFLNSPTFSQSDSSGFQTIGQSYFRDDYRYLSSDITEGREVGTPGSDSASTYIVRKIISLGLLPFFLDKDSFVYVQKFKLLKQSLKYSSLEICNVSTSEMIKVPALYSEYSGYFPGDFKNSFSGVFCGYGISSKEVSYNDYENINVKGKAVIILDHYPGYTDTLSPAYRTFKTINAEEIIDRESKIKTAAEQGATCIIFIEDDNSDNEVASGPDYKDSGYFLPDLLPNSIPCLIIQKKDASILLSLKETQFEKIERKAAKLLKTNSFPLDRKSISVSLSFKTDTVQAKNIAGKYCGKDSTKLFIVGAHYDHLGKRGSLIYNGADDNASGASGVLGLAKFITEKGLLPEYTMIFAFWDAEEKGLLGSSQFLESYSGSYSDIIQYINMDMISRSAPEDSLHHIISIGTRPIDQDIRKAAEMKNSQLTTPFVLDLWDVTGHFGSDYASFRDKNIPVMTFFSGFHDDYHTPSDVFSKVDLNKMTSILQFIYSLIYGMNFKPEN